MSQEHSSGYKETERELRIGLNGRAKEKLAANRADFRSSLKTGFR
jgi:hypothetical protein